MAAKKPKHFAEVALEGSVLTELAGELYHEATDPTDDQKITVYLYPQKDGGGYGVDIRALAGNRSKQERVAEATRDVLSYARRGTSTGLEAAWPVGTGNVDAPNEGEERMIQITLIDPDYKPAEAAQKGGKKAATGQRETTAAQPSTNDQPVGEDS